MVFFILALIIIEISKFVDDSCGFFFNLLWQYFAQSNMTSQPNLTLSLTLTLKMTLNVGSKTPSLMRALGMPQRKAFRGLCVMVRISWGRRRP